MRQPKFWDESALEACGAIFDAPRTVPSDIQNIRTHLDLFIGLYFDNHAGEDFHSGVTDCWKSLGSDAIVLNEQRAIAGRTELLSVEDVVQTLVRKQRDYGHENIRRFGRSGLIIRCHDKVARYENLCGSDFTPNNESIDDTLLDIIGYSAIGIMWEQGEFLLPLAPPKKSEKLLATVRETR